MLVFRKNIHALIGMVLVVVASSVNAASINYTITGDVTFAGANTFGLSDGSTITATGTIDDAAFGYTDGHVSGSLLGGDYLGYIYFNAGSGNTMTITVGNTVFDASNDYSYTTGTTPALHFDGGVLDDFDTWMLAGTNGAPENFGSLFLNFEDGVSMLGQWRTAVEFSSISPVPVPAAIWLFGSGLLGLIGLAKRK